MITVYVTYWLLHVEGPFCVLRLHLDRAAITYLWEWVRFRIPYSVPYSVPEGWLWEHFRIPYSVFRIPYSVFCISAPGSSVLRPIQRVLCIRSLAVVTC